jgi:hypothetical protein
MYKLLHKPTGLYFCPSREIKGTWTRPTDGRKFNNYVKSNLSKTGKVYQNRPSFKYISGGFWNHLDVHPSSTALYPWLVSRLNTFIESEWEIVEV